MAGRKQRVAKRKRSLFRETMAGVQAMRDNREGRVTLKTREVHPIAVPPIDARTVRETREALNMSRQVFAFKIGVNPGRSNAGSRDGVSPTSRRLRCCGWCGDILTRSRG